MKLEALKLYNFRCYKDEVTIPFEDLTALIGRNDVGKSSVLDALGIFLECPIVKLDPSDLCVRAQDSEVVIGCVFSDLPEEIVLDATAKTTLADEHLLNLQGNLEIHKIFTVSGKKPKQQTVAFAHHPSADGADNLLSLKISELKKIAKSLGIGNEVDHRSNPLLRHAIWDKIGDLNLVTRRIPLDQEDAKNIWEQISKKLPYFALFRADRPSNDQDAEVQDPMKVAVQRAISELEEQIKEIENRVHKHTLEVAERTIEKLHEYDKSLAQELRPHFKAEPKWDSIFKLSLTDDQQIPINKRGSGARRLVLLSFFQAEAERERTSKDKSNIIYAIEEPETSQHPHNQRLIVKALHELSEQDGCQVILSTHVPALAELLPAKSIRHITASEDRVISVDYGRAETCNAVAKDLGVLPDKRVKVILCVEGSNDIECLKHFARVLRTEDASLPDLANDVRITTIPLGGDTLKHWVYKHYLGNFQLPEVHIYDRDSGQSPLKQESCEKVNQRKDGSKAFLTKKREMENYLHPDAVQQVLGVNVGFGDDDDVPEIVGQAVGHSERKIKKRLNNEVAAAMTPDLLDQCGGKEEIVEWLRCIGSLLE